MPREDARSSVNQPSAKKNPGETPLPLRQNRRRVLPFPTAQPKKVLSIVKQVVIGPRLRRAGVVVFDECAGFSIFVGSTATDSSSDHVGARRLRVRLPLGGVRLHSQLHSVPRGRRSSGTGRRCATIRAIRRCNAGRLSVRLLSRPVR